MDQSEQSKLARALQQEFYPGRRVWRRADGEPKTVRYAYVDRDGESIVVVYELWTEGTRIGAFSLTPPDVPGTYIVDSEKGTTRVTLYRFDGEYWRQIDPSGDIVRVTDPPTARKIQISNDTEGPVFPEGDE